MYTITKRRGPWQTAAMTRDRKIKFLVICVEPDCLAIKTKGTRTWFRLPYTHIFNRAVMAHVLALKAAKRERRKSVRRGVLAIGGGR